MRSSEAAALDPLDARGQRVSKSQPVTMMANLEEMSRVLYSHDWARVQDWVTALDQLATLTDDEIAALVLRRRAAGELHPSPLIVSRLRLRQQESPDP